MIWNVIDRRRRPYRWKRVNAIVEAVEHDNSCPDADQAPDADPRIVVDYDALEGVSVAQAVAWACQQPCPVTLYLYDDGSGTSREEHFKASETRLISEAPLRAILSAYHNAAVRHGDATEAGDHRKANRAAEEISRLYAEIRKRGEGAQREILSFLSDPSPGVRLWSAAHALEIDSRAGEAALGELVGVGRLFGFSAEITPKEWRAGRLKFP